MRSRIVILSVLILCCFLGLMFKGFRLQLFPRENLISVKKRLFEKVVAIKPRRGSIYDRYGRELALSVSSHSLFADPSLIENPKQISRKLSKLLGIPRKKLFNKIKNKKKRFVWIKRPISEKKRKVIQSWNVEGLAFIEEPQRVYPNGRLMSQVLGFTGRDGQGLEGLELVYDDILKGREQKVITSKDARGRPLFIDGGLFINQSRGFDLYLTIDSDLQFVLERELGKAVQKYNARSAMGLILHAGTSEILALAHQPRFDPNRPLSFKPQTYRNRIVSDVFEPGSTFKTFIVAAALKENIPPHTQYDGQKGSLQIGKHIIREAEAHHQYEELSISEILSLSSNVGAAQMALSLTAPVLYPILKEFGFGDKLRVNFPLEGKGSLKKPPWSQILTATVGFGQGVSATPLQMAVAYTVIANGGFLKKPYILKSKVNLSGQEVHTPPSTVIQRVLTQEQSDTLTLMLGRVVSSQGTGSQAQVQGFLTAGKTGTAQKPDLKKGGYKKDKYISSFIGFVPADQPRFVIYIAVDEPLEKFYGSVVAAPVFSSVASYAVRRAGLAPSFIEEPNILTQQNLQVKIPARDESGLFEKIPNFKGLSLREAVQKAKSFKLKLKAQGSGLVKKTIPNPGHPMPKNRQVLVILEEGE